MEENIDLLREDLAEAAGGASDRPSESVTIDGNPLPVFIYGPVPCEADPDDLERTSAPYYVVQREESR